MSSLGFLRFTVSPLLGIHSQQHLIRIATVALVFDSILTFPNVIGKLWTVKYTPTRTCLAWQSLSAAGSVVAMCASLSRRGRRRTDSYLDQPAWRILSVVAFAKGSEFMTYWKTSPLRGFDFIHSFVFNCPAVFTF